jgi:hypothetical protein
MVIKQSSSEALHRLLEHLRVEIELVAEKRHEELLERAAGLLRDVAAQIAVAVLAVLGLDLVADVVLAQNAAGVAHARHLGEQVLGDRADVAVIQRFGEVVHDLLDRGAFERLLGASDAADTWNVQKSANRDR